MKTRFDVIRFITYHIVGGKGIKIQLDGHDLSMQYASGGYAIWHDETDHTIAAIIHECDRAEKDTCSDWAKERVEFYDL